MYATLKYFCVAARSVVIQQCKISLFWCIWRGSEALYLLVSEDSQNVEGVLEFS